MLGEVSMEPINYTEMNSKAIDNWVDNGWEWGVPITPEAFAEAKNGRLGVVLSPQKKVPVEWLSPYIKDGRLPGVKVLGLASGGGQQMPVFAALGADCTVLDYSDRQLENERLVSKREGYKIDIVKADMTKRLPFGDSSFDIIFHPVSNCYVEDVYHVWNECFRVLKSGGVLLAGMGNGFDYCFEEDGPDPLRVVNRLPYNPLKNPELLKKSMDDEQDGSVQFSHTMEEQIGGQLKAGLVLTDLYEDSDPCDGGAPGWYYPQYLVTRSVKP
jgi:SAM-dependent methyltransferase